MNLTMGAALRYAAVNLELTAGICSTTLYVVPVVGPFTPSRNLTYDDVVLNTALLDPKPDNGDSQFLYRDSINGDLVVFLSETSTQWTWYVATDQPTPTTVYGWALVDTGTNILYGSATFPTPIPFQQAWNFVNIGEVSFRYSTAYFG